MTRRSSQKTTQKQSHVESEDAESEPMPSESEEEPVASSSTASRGSRRRSAGHSRQHKNSSDAELTNNSGDEDVPFVIPPVMSTYAEQEAARNTDHFNPTGQAAASSGEVHEEVLIQHGEEINLDADATNEDDWKTDDEVEVSHVIVDLNGFADKTSIVEKVKKGLCRVRHPNTDQPIVQIGGQLFAGKYHESDGSIMIMEQKAEPDATYTLLGVTDVVMDSQKSYIYAKDANVECEKSDFLKKPLAMGSEQRVNKALPTSFRKKC